MKKLLIVFALIVAFSAFTFANTQEASAMNKGELVDAIAKDAGLSKADAKRALEAMPAAIATALRKGNTVQLVGFGSFSISKRAARSLVGQDDLSARERGCVWLAGGAPEWLHGLFCTVSDTEIVALMAKADDGSPKPLGADLALRCLNSFKSVTTGQLVIRDDVDATDFGEFSVEEGRGRRLNIVEFDAAAAFTERVGRNPQTGSTTKNVVKFKAGADLSKKVN